MRVNTMKLSFVGLVALALSSACKGNSHEYTAGQASGGNGVGGESAGGVSEGGEFAAGHSGSGGLTDGEGGSSASTLPNLEDLVNPSAAECTTNQDGVEAPGAQTYVLGEFETTSANSLVGTERWMLFANDAWKAQDGEDCEVVWSHVVKVGSLDGGCSSCTLAMDVVGTVDTSASTCPEGTAGDFEAHFELVLNEDYSVLWFNEGKQFGTGYWNVEGDFNFITDADCYWLP